jgi:hypothetical protein
MKEFVSRPAEPWPEQAASPGDRSRRAPRRDRAAQAAPPTTEDPAQAKARRRSGILAELDELAGRFL